MVVGLDWPIAAGFFEQRRRFDTFRHGFKMWLACKQKAGETDPIVIAGIRTWRVMSLSHKAGLTSQFCQETAVPQTSGSWLHSESVLLRYQGDLGDVGCVDGLLPRSRGAGSSPPYRKSLPPPMRGGNPSSSSRLCAARRGVGRQPRGVHEHMGGVRCCEVPFTINTEE